MLIGFVLRQVRYRCGALCFVVGDHNLDVTWVAEAHGAFGVHIPSEYHETAFAEFKFPACDMEEVGPFLAVFCDGHNEFFGPFQCERRWTR